MKITKLEFNKIIRALNLASDYEIEYGSCWQVKSKERIAATKQSLSFIKLKNKLIARGSR